MYDCERILKYAIVDIGANSVRMNIYDIDKENGTFSVFSSARSLLGLAAYVTNGALSPDGAGKLFSVLREFLARANSLPCDGFYAFATASLRGLSNSEALCRNILNRLGIHIEIISGEREAGYDLSAIRYRFPEAENGTLLDLGGGSTEIVTFDQNGAKTAVSLPIGCVMLTKRFTACDKQSPFPAKDSLLHITDYVASTMCENGVPKGIGGTAYLIGGTARAAAKLHSAITEGKPVSDGYTFTVSDLEKTAEAILLDVENGGKLLRSVVPDRLTTVIPGITAYLAIARHLGLTSFKISNAGVREGFLIEFIGKILPQTAQET